MAKAKHPHDAKRPEPKAVREAVENGDIDALLRALSVRQKRFAEEYAIDFNGTAAAIRAGYATGHADRQAHILLKHKGVSAYIDHLTKTKENKIVSIDPDYIVQRIVKTIDKAEEIVNLTAVLRGLELLARHKGMLTDKQEISGPDGGPLEIEQKRRVQEEVENFTNQLRSLVEKNKGKPDLKVVGKDA